MATGSNPTDDGKRADVPGVLQFAKDNPAFSLPIAMGLLYLIAQAHVRGFLGAFGAKIEWFDLSLSTVTATGWPAVIIAVVATTLSMALEHAQLHDRKRWGALLVIWLALFVFLSWCLADAVAYEHGGRWALLAIAAPMIWAAGPIVSRYRFDHTLRLARRTGTLHGVRDALNGRDVDNGVAESVIASRFPDAQKLDRWWNRVQEGKWIYVGEALGWLSLGYLSLVIAQWIGLSSGVARLREMARSEQTFGFAFTATNAPSTRDQSLSVELAATQLVFTDGTRYLIRRFDGQTSWIELHDSLEELSIAGESAKEQRERLVRVIRQLDADLDALQAETRARLDAIGP